MSNIINHVSVEFPTENEIIEEKNESRKWFSILQEFSTSTTAHGLPRIASSSSRHNCIYWSIAFIVCTGLMLFFIVQAILNYLSYPTQIDISIDDEWPHSFPAFSFCNAGGLRLDTFMIPFLSYLHALNVTNTNDTSTVQPEHASYLGPFTRDLFNRNDSLEQFSYPLSSMLLFCRYNSQPCTAADFTPFITTDYGYCYTFNGKLKNTSDDSILDGTEYDGSGKLELGLYVHSHQYIPYIADSVGIVALIHDNTQLPLMDLSGFNLIPGQKHKFSYRKKTNSFLSSPYTSCRSKIDPWMRTMFTNYAAFDYGYCKQLCVKLEIQIHTYVQCGCVNPYIWDMRSLILPGTDTVILAPLCDSTDSCYAEAGFAYINSTAGLTNEDEKCRQECSMTDFIIKKSSLVTPVSWQLYGIKNYVEQLAIPLPLDWSTAWPEYIYTNYLAVTVVRETTVVENNIQSASLNFLDVLSNIGGQTGLWIGISLLSVMELFEMIYRLMRFQCHMIRSYIRKA
ncbi:hypothetical protein I4U23_023357 [Adineta vaga]|nr:hypothetical protein I4U23_023357 [Adineta vaga]